MTEKLFINGYKTHFIVKPKNLKMYLNYIEVWSISIGAFFELKNVYKNHFLYWVNTFSEFLSLIVTVLFILYHP